jgi:F-type H+-transporting ATPase subunit b
VLAWVTLAVVLGVGFHMRETTVRAQTAGVASTPEAQTPEKDKPEQDANDAYRKSPSVVWLGKKLGIGTDRASILSEVSNFVLLAVAVLWGLAKFLPKTIRDRNTAIQKRLVDARTATEEARARLGGVEERLAKLDGEIAAMRSQAEQDSAKEEQRIKAALEDETKKILATAEQEISAATMHARKQLQQHAAELAIEQAAQRLVVSAETDRLLVQRFAQQLAGDESKKGQN